ncbi:hypothetical protein KAZ82_00435 [Candidatus Babeliales bacterium]|nr:hypothetical protein [Candidatus Babeliales bacterium]
MNKSVFLSMVILAVVHFENIQTKSVQGLGSDSEIIQPLPNERLMPTLLQQYHQDLFDATQNYIQALKSANGDAKKINAAASAYQKIVETIDSKYPKLVKQSSEKNAEQVAAQQEKIKLWRVMLKKLKAEYAPVLGMFWQDENVLSRVTWDNFEKLSVAQRELRRNVSRRAFKALQLQYAAPFKEYQEKLLNLQHEIWND